MAVTAASNTAEPDLSRLRAHFDDGVIGKLPKVTCGQCSKGQCGNHKKEKCRECGAWISTAHIHIDYVGHADVTDRILDVDPAWSWKPQATDPDPAALKAAIESGNLDIVRMVIENAPPKFERASNGNPVGLWIWLTIGGETKAGYGSCPATQMDAEKVLIGDALRNAGMRFGIATYLWAKGERQDPTAENPAGEGGTAEQHARKPEQPRGRVSQPERQQRGQSAEIPVDWGIRIDGLDDDADFDKAKAELDEAHAAGRLPAPVANAILQALKDRRAAIAGRRSGAA